MNVKTDVSAGRKVLCTEKYPYSWKFLKIHFRLKSSKGQGHYFEISFIFFIFSFFLFLV